MSVGIKIGGIIKQRNSPRQTISLLRCLILILILMAGSEQNIGWDYGVSALELDGYLLPRGEQREKKKSKDRKVFVSLLILFSSV
jgi:hypothetical protein